MHPGLRLFAAAAVLLSAHLASAQTNLALDRFDPAVAGDAFFGVEAPPMPSDFAIRARATFNWAHHPLVLRDANDDTRRYVVVRNQVFGNIGGAFEVWKRLTLSVDLPVAIAQTGPNIGSTTISQPDGARVGDLRLGARVLLLQPRDWFHVSIAGFAYAPTGGSDSQASAYVSDDKWRGRAQVILNGVSDRILWSFVAGPEFRDSQRYVGVRQGGTLIRGGAAVAVRLLEDRSLQIGP